MNPTWQAAAAGYVIVVVSALTFAGNNVLAALAFEHGTTPLTLIAARTVFAVFALAALIGITGGALALPRRDGLVAAGLGILNGAMGYCLMSAFEKLAVGLAILIFYLYPVLTGALAWATGQDRLDRGLVAGLVGGFAGLALALEFSGADGSLSGMALAGAAALMMAVTIVVSARVLRGDNSRAVTLYMQASAAAMFVALVAATGDLALPRTGTGWAGSAGVLVLYTAAVATLFASIARIGGVRASLVMNLEPVASIGLGFALLGQVLTPRQLAGAAIVLAAVTAVRWLKR